MYIYFFFFFTKSFLFYPTSKETIRVKPSKEEEKNWLCDNCDNDRKNTRRKQGRAEIEKWCARCLDTDTNDSMKISTSIARPFVDVSFGSSRIRSSYFFSTHFRGDNSRARVFSLFFDGLCGKCKWHTSIAVVFDSRLSLSNASERNREKRIWLMASLLKRQVDCGYLCERLLHHIALEIVFQFDVAFEIFQFVAELGRKLSTRRIIFSEFLWTRISLNFRFLD